MSARPEPRCSPRDQLLAVADVMRRMLVVRQQAQFAAREIAGLNEAVVRQIAPAPVVLKRLIEMPEMRRGIEQQITERQRLWHVVAVDAPAAPFLAQPLEEGRTTKRNLVNIIIGVTAGGSGMREKAIGPGLARRRSIPLVADTEGTRQSAYNRHLPRREIMHDRRRKRWRVGRFLRHVVVDEAAHGRHLNTGHAALPEELLANIREQLAGSGSGMAAVAASMSALCQTGIV